MSAAVPIESGRLPLENGRWTVGLRGVVLDCTDTCWCHRTPVMADPTPRKTGDWSRSASKQYGGAVRMANKFPEPRARAVLHVSRRQDGQAALGFNLVTLAVDGRINQYRGPAKNPLYSVRARPPCSCGQAILPGGLSGGRRASGGTRTERQINGRHQGLALRPIVVHLAPSLAFL